MENTVALLEQIKKGFHDMNVECSKLEVKMKQNEDNIIIVHTPHPMFFDRDKFEKYTGITRDRVNIPEKVLNDNGEGFIFNTKYIIIKC